MSGNPLEYPNNNFVTPNGMASPSKKSSMTVSKKSQISAERKSLAIPSKKS